MSIPARFIDLLSALDEEVLSVNSLFGDGSARSYCRVVTPASSYIILVGVDQVENATWLKVRSHLEERGIRVPRLMNVDEPGGLILMEDLGEASLLSLANNCATEDRTLELYEPVLELLVEMQSRGAEGMDPQQGFHFSPYDAGVMVEEEGLYFVREVAESLLGIIIDRERFVDLFIRLASTVDPVDGVWFLHRDFQSRNIYFAPDTPAVIDFQGARPGPVGYDAAALLLDPYPDHSVEVRDRLLERLLKLARDAGIGENLERTWDVTGIFRLLQALGAFAKLGARFKKPGFLEHVSKGLALLSCQLDERKFSSGFGVDTAMLAELVEKCSERWREIKDDYPLC